MREPWWPQYLKLAFLEKLIVTTWSVFQNQVTYCGTFNCDNKGASPVSTCLWKIPYALKELEKKLEDLDLLRSGCIEESNSPYTSALVLVAM